MAGFQSLIIFEDCNTAAKQISRAPAKSNIMKKIVLGTALVISAGLLACNSSDSPEVDKSIMPSQSASPAAISVLPDSSQVIQPVNQVNTSQPAITTTPAKVTPAIAGSGSSAPNPAHGQPGHRCDIAVGAPLNSAATIPSQPKVQQTVSSPAAVTATPSAPTAIPVSTDPNAKLNPAHGQPGHDCSIAVGAPLKKN